MAKRKSGNADSGGIVERGLPHHSEAERIVLGSVLLNGNSFDDVVEFLNADDFYHEKHATIYRIMHGLYLAGEPIDVQSLAEQVAKAKATKQIGGLSYLGELLDTTPTAAMAARYASIVHEKALLRRAIVGATEAIQTAYEAAAEPEHVSTILERVIENMTDDGSPGPVEITELLPDALQRLASLHKHGETGGPGLLTGFADLDRKLHGFQSGDLVVVAGRTSMGKTTFALDVTRHVIRADPDAVVVFFTLEMTQAQVLDRILCAEAGASLRQLYSPVYYGPECERLREAAIRLGGRPIEIDDLARAPATLDHIKSVARTTSRRRKRLDLVVVDYLQLIEPPRIGGRRETNRTQEVSAISRGLKSLARELNVPVMALSQLSRQVDNRPGNVPRLSDLRESGTIEQDADIVLLLNRPIVWDKTEDPTLAVVDVAKHRNGPTGKVELNFFGDKQRFENRESYQPPPDDVPPKRQSADDTDLLV